MRKWIKYVLGFLAILLVPLIVVSAYLYWNRDAFREQALETLKRETGALISIKSAGFDVFSFPNFAIRLDSVVISDSNVAVHKSPVLELGRMELQASLYSLLSGSVSIESVWFRDGIFRIEQYADSSSNFLFFNNLVNTNRKKKKEDTTKEPFQFKIKNLEWHNIAFDFNDSVKQKRIKLTLKDVVQKFTTSDTAIHFTMKGEIPVDSLGFNLEKGAFVANTTLQTDFVLSWNPGKKQLSWEGSKFKAKDHPFEVNGGLYAGKPMVLDLRIKTKQVLEKDVLPMLTEKIAAKIALYEATGPLDAEAVIGGEISPGKDPQVMIAFEGVNQKFTAHLMKQSFFLQHFKGFYSNQINKTKEADDQNSSLTINRVEGVWNGYPFIVSGEIKQFEHPHLNGFVNITLKQKQMARLTETLPFNPTESMGWLKARYNGLIDDIVSQKKGFGIDNWKGSAHFQIKDAIWKGSDLRFKDVVAKCQINGDALKVENLSGELSGNRITASGSMKGLAHHIGDPALPVFVEMKVNSKDFDINPLISTEKKSPKPKTASTIKGEDSFNFNIRLAMNADKVKFRKLECSDLSGNIELKNNRLTLDGMKFNVGGGEVTVESSIENLTGTKKDISSVIYMYQVDVKKLFTGMNQFGQDVFKSENLEGKLNLDSELSFELDQYFDIRPESMKGDVSFQLKKAKLINFKPLTELSGFLMPKESLEEVQLATLGSTFHFNGRNVSMDEIELPTSLATFFVQGEYDFANKLDISVLVPIHTISRKNQNEIIKRGGKEKERSAIPIRVYKKNGKVEIGLDRERAAKRLWKRIKGWTS